MEIVGQQEASQTISPSYPQSGQRVIRTEKDPTGWADIVAENEREEDDV